MSDLTHWIGRPLTEVDTPSLLLDADELAPGTSGFVQFFLREPLALKPGDRLVIRCISPAFPWGGGLALHVNPPRHRRRQEALLA